MAVLWFESYGDTWQYRVQRSVTDVLNNYSDVFRLPAFRVVGIRFPLSPSRMSRYWKNELWQGLQGFSDLPNVWDKHTERMTDKATTTIRYDARFISYGLHWHSNCSEERKPSCLVKCSRLLKDFSEQARATDPQSKNISAFRWELKSLSSIAHEPGRLSISHKINENAQICLQPSKEHVENSNRKPTCSFAHSVLLFLGIWMPSRLRARFTWT